MPTPESVTSMMPWLVLGHHPQADGPAAGQRVDRIEDEIGHQLAQLRRGALNGRVALRLDVQTDGPTFGLRRVAPARSGQLRRVAHQAAEVHRLAVLLGRSPREQQQPFDRLAAVQGRLGGRGQQVLELRPGSADPATSA